MELEIIFWCGTNFLGLPQNVDSPKCVSFFGLAQNIWNSPNNLGFVKRRGIPPHHFIEPMHFEELKFQIAYATPETI